MAAQNPVIAQNPAAARNSVDRKRFLEAFEAQQLAEARARSLRSEFQEDVIRQSLEGMHNLALDESQYTLESDEQRRAFKEAKILEEARRASRLQLENERKRRAEEEAKALEDARQASLREAARQSSLRNDSNANNSAHSNTDDKDLAAAISASMAISQEQRNVETNQRVTNQRAANHEATSQRASNHEATSQRPSTQRAQSSSGRDVFVTEQSGDVKADFEIDRALAELALQNSRLSAGSQSANVSDDRHEEGKRRTNSQSSHSVSASVPIQQPNVIPANVAPPNVLPASNQQLLANQSQSPAVAPAAIVWSDLRRDCLAARLRQRQAGSAGRNAGAGRGRSSANKLGSS